MTWVCELRIRHPSSFIEAWLMGYGATPEAALRNAKDLAAYRKEKQVEGVKPVLKELRDEATERVPMVSR